MVSALNDEYIFGFSPGLLSLVEQLATLKACHLWKRFASFSSMSGETTFVWFMSAWCHRYVLEGGGGALLYVEFWLL